MKFRVRFPGSIQGGQRVCTVGDGDGLHAPAGEHCNQGLAIGGVVDRNQHANVLQRIRRNTLDVFGGSLLSRQANRKVKSATVVNFTFNPNPPAHEFHQPRGNAEAESGAAILTGHRSIGLRKRLENERLLVGRDSNTGVRNDEMQQHSAGVLGLYFDPQEDFSPMGEFDRVSDEVDDDLANASGITYECVGNVGRNIKRKF